MSGDMSEPLPTLNKYAGRAIESDKLPNVNVKMYPLSL